MKVEYRSEDGITIVENLVAISLFLITLAGSHSLFSYSMHSNASARTYTTLATDVQELMDSFRKDSYTGLLDKFSTTYTAIADGQTVTETIQSSDARASYQVTYTAIKSKASSSSLAL